MTTTTRTSKASGDAAQFLEALFEPGDTMLIRPIETWTEDNRKRSAVDYKGIHYQLVGLRGQAGQSQRFPQRLTNAIARQNERAAETRCNIFYGVCPRFGIGGQYDQAWQIRTARVLWTDVDLCTVDEALERCKAAALPEPSIVVASGNGVHLYWLLSDPYLIDDAGDPPPVFTEFIDQSQGRKKKSRKFLKNADGEKVYIDGKDKHNAPALSTKAQHFQDILAGIAAKIGGDHTTDLSRILRIPGTMNRKDERNAKEPKPCTLVQCDPSRRYSIDTFSQYAEASPDRARRETVAKVKLPSPRKLSPTKLDRFQELLLQCTAAQVGTRSEADYRLCCWAIEHGMASEAVWTEAQLVGKFAEAGERYFDRTWSRAAEHTREKIYTRIERKAAQRHAEPGGNGQAAAPEANGNEREITIGTDESRVVDEAIEVLATRENVYQRGGCLVHVVQGTEPPRGIARPKDAPRIATMRYPRIRELLADAAAWYKPAAGEQDRERIHPPDWVVKAIDARGQWRGIRRLEAVVEVPTLRADGTVLQEPGYDSLTGILFQPKATFPPVADHPTAAQAKQARDALLEIVEDFPFQTDAHKAAWLAALITPLARYGFHGPAPLFLIDANVRGSGKSLLADVVSEINAGREMSRMSQPKDDDECRKRITAVAVAGETLMLLDNLDRMLGNASLDAALTATSWTDRILGTSEMASGTPLFATWYATGNNVIMAADTARRTVHIRLESPEENPEEREGFHHPDLLRWVRQERPRLAVAAVTILAGYCAAGRPNMAVRPWGSFEAWSDLVRQAIVWSGLPDPGATRKELTSQADREAAALRQLIAGWEEIDPSGAGMTVAAVLKILLESPHDHEGLRAALWELAPPRDGKTLNARSIGMRLHHLRRRVVDGKFLDRRDGDQGAIWKIEAGTTGTTGTKSGHPARAGACAHPHTRETPGTTPNSPCSPRSPGDCLHLDVEETPTQDGYVNRTCRTCGEPLRCRAAEVTA